MSRVNRPGFSQEHHDIWKEVNQMVSKEIPSFNDIWNPAILSNMKIAPFDPEQAKSLGGYIESLFSACAQGLYAIQCLVGFSTHEKSNITQFYVAYFVDDFIVRVKTGTDLLALIIKHIYKLKIKNSRCSLEDQYFADELRKNKSASETVEDLAKEIDTVRLDWLESFDKLRNFVIHQAGFRLTGTAYDEYPVDIQIPLPKAVPRDKEVSIDPHTILEFFRYDNEPLGQFLFKINSKNMTPFFTINPVLLCYDVWKMWSNSTEKILGLCKEDILAKLDGKPD